MVSIARGQNYFKLSEKSDIYFNQQIDRFPNQDILIADSSLEPLMTSRDDGKVVMTRIDRCGNKIWSYSYSLGFGYIELRDFVINDNEEILAYGSYFNGTEEFLFLLSINGETGRNAVFHIYDPKTINGYFAYSLLAIDNQYLVYGFLVNPNIGFMALFDKSLQPIWAKKISPFQANGAALVTNNKNIFARTGSSLFMMDSKGDIEWASESNISIVNGPIETTTGLIFEGHKEGLSLIYKLDNKGQVMWQSEAYEAVETSSAISILQNEDIFITYNCPFNDENKLCQLGLSPSGQIFEQRYLSHPQNLNTGILTQTISEDDIITIAANANAFVAGDKKSSDFILQFPLGEMNGNCISWDNYIEPSKGDLNLNFEASTINADDFDLEILERTEAIVDTFLFPLNELCDDVASTNLIQNDTLLSCAEDWIVSLPNERFVWDDGSLDNPRVLKEPGNYKAKNDNCKDPIILEFQLDKKNCDCSWYLPNAFKPNNAGINDKLGFFSDCDLVEFQIHIYSQSGLLVFQSNDSNQFWNGDYQQIDASVGVYVASVEFKWLDSEGQIQEESYYQDITLVR